MRKKSKKFSVGVIGPGYVGLLSMLHLLSKKKMDYYGFDKDPKKKIDLLKKTNPIFQMSQVNN